MAERAVATTAVVIVVLVLSVVLRHLLGLPL